MRSKLECLSMARLFNPWVILTSADATNSWKRFTNTLAYLTLKTAKLECLSMARLFNPWVISVSTGATRNEKPLQTL